MLGFETFLMKAQDLLCAVHLGRACLALGWRCRQSKLKGLVSLAFS